MELIGAIVTLIGAIFLFLGALGILRMPDVYNRMQAGTKATTLGSIFFLFGICIGHSVGVCFWKIVLLILFLIFTNPISSHTLARAAHFAGIKLAKRSVKDDLEKDENESVNEDFKGEEI
ncbi:MAG: monovalent cation/H(+) antiporter subunit G [Candidatus Cloacimonetes bacterium]|nr:monovalent cation/H(+) antiporter subunit G [Candidatus Cloacimonadota bacterium]MCF7813512.1 monovalent cation/H(+) antiporter subunit G [Candidatus Cloacimonadota bacterium]MCF7868704.1 monovalent cation/H(+) antiporter subunit G [Candidatus Cloacimonadota bacterium]MCF7884670.1 monovalent cation/H(+) antiporter subunit G [Candidatus Cloacimonadota bacterium]